jgi:hypothetical protein
MRMVHTTLIMACEDCDRDFERGEIVAYVTDTHQTICQACANRSNKQRIELREVIGKKEER